MAPKKKKKDIIAQSPGLKTGRSLDQQAIEDTLTIAEVRQFITDSEKKAADYLNIADRSWQEIEKRNADGKLYGGNNLNIARRWVKFPLWWSVWKIRQPITFARLPIPSLKDTKGDDPFGRTACVLGERFTRSILKTFEMLPEISTSNDDFLVTNFGWGRAFYRNTLCKEEEKIRLQVIPPQAEGQPPMFLLPSGEPVLDPTSVLRDDMGAYILTGQEITVDNEEVYFEAGLYPNLIVDPDANRWNKVTRLAYKYRYSYREFIAKFGEDALNTLVTADIDKHKTGTPIIVYEYWDKTLKEVRWLAENSTDFFQPGDMQEVSYGESDENIEDLDSVKPSKEGAKDSGVDNSDIYGLTNFFPSTEPLIINQSTKHFWPTPEYFQVCDLLDDITSIVGRMVHLTKAIRVRFLFDSSVAELKTLIGDNWAAGEGSGIGIPNLAAALMNDKNADLSRLVAYFPVDKLIEGLKNMYEAFDQRLNMFYQITGISDLIRGQTNPDSDKTFGERQMEGKFALNRIEPYQRKLQEWIKDQYQLLMELGFKMFSDETIDKYITPQTLDPEDKQRYDAALQLLKDNKQARFRIDFETDSTIAINEQWKRGQAIETANVITKMQEAAAKTAKEFPELVESQLKIMSHVIGELTDGKLFLDEIQDSIKQVIDKVNQPKEPEFNKDQADHQLQMAKFQFEQQNAVSDNQLEQMRLTMEGQIEGAKIAQKDRLDGFALQLQQIKQQSEEGLNIAELNLKSQTLQSEIALAQEELNTKRQEFLLAAKEIADKTQLKQLELMMDARVSEQKQKLDELYAGLEREKTMLVEKEKWVTELRLQDEHRLTQQEHQLNTVQGLVDIQKTIKEMKAIPTPVTVELKQEPKKKTRKRGKIIRDADGRPDYLELEELDE